jgi:imidazolonepropionase
MPLRLSRKESGNEPGRDNRIGSLEAGKQADLAVFAVEDFREIPYYFGMNRCWMTMKRGEIIHMQD